MASLCSGRYLGRMTDSAAIPVPPQPQRVRKPDWIRVKAPT
ncbi:lipoyl synthase, partial [Sphingobium tyrosinilyticum]